MRRLLLATRLTNIWLEALPAIAWAAYTATTPTWIAFVGTTIAAAGYTARAWLRKDFHQNIENTVELLVRYHWPHDDLKLISVKAEGPFTLPQILSQRFRTKRWGAPVHRLTLTIWGQPDVNKIAEWARIQYEFSTPEPTPSRKSVGAWDITLTHTDMPEKVLAA